MAAIALPRTVRLGAGALGEVASALAAHGLRRPMIVTDAYMATQEALGRLVGLLARGGMTPRVFAGAVPDPTTDAVAAAVAALDDGAHDCVIGFGGGSSIDTAKAASVLAVHRVEMRTLKVPHVQDAPGLPIVAIPTTAGTGSEATRVAVVTDSATGEKMLCLGLAYLPTVAIVDYELTLSCPRRLSADTGIDALTHAIEAYVSRQANPFSDGMALAAMRAIWPHIRTACGGGIKREARAHMMVGAFQAGIAFSNSSVALVHGMSRPLGAHFHVAHGLSNAMLLPAVARWSLQGAAGRYAACARAMGIAAEDVADAPASAALLDALDALNADLDVPSPRGHGIDASRWEALIPLMAEQALASGSPQNNPRVPDLAEIEALYRAVF